MQVMIYSPFTKFLDWLSAMMSFILIPVIAILVICYSFSIVDEIYGSILVGIIIFAILIFISFYYAHNYRILKKFANETQYVHFRPSNKDLVLGLYGQVFTIIVAIIVIVMFLFQIVLTTSPLNLFLLSAGITFILQIIQIFFMNHSKIKLISTAQEPVNESLLQQLNEKTSDSSKINHFYFADIKPASLFLSAGVTNYSFKSNICLVSRYFQWKLSEDELMAVLGHEIGHVVHKDLLQSKILLNLQVLVRTFFFYFLLIILRNFVSNSGIDPNLLLIQLAIFICIIINQVLISFSFQLRMFNQEILADEYGASVMGNYNLSHTLKKLPSVIPAPVDDNPLQFLGFRIAILNLRAKKNGESETIIREFSRFSNN